MDSIDGDLEKLSAADLERLVALAKHAGVKRRDGAMIRRVPRDGDAEGKIALSFAQERIWFLSRLKGMSATFHIPTRLRLRGPLDVAAWRASLDRLLARHEAWRTVFATDGGKPSARLVGTDTGFALVEQAVADDDELERACAGEAQAPFDLERGPLVRGRLIRRAPDDHVFALTQHHLVSDGWSIGVLLRELGALYRAFAAGRADPLPPLELQYPDYAAWQRQYLTGERREAQVAYWRAQLGAAPAALALPTDRPRPAEQDYDGGWIALELDAELTAGLQRVSRDHGATLFMTLLGAWAAVLARLAGQAEVVVGAAIADRGQSEVDGLIGPFVNALALRIDRSGDPSLGELIARVRRTALEAQQHRDLPFDQVVEAVAPPRRMDRTPVFQVMFSWQGHDDATLELPGLRVELAAVRPDRVQHDLELNLVERAGRITGGLVYARSLFDAETVERHRGYLVTVLRALIADPRQSLARLPLLAPAERRLLEAWAAGRARSTTRCLHELFETRVAAAPDAVAVVHDDETMTYAELDARANRWAHQLIAQGVGPDTRVVLCVERHPRMIVGLLAILKAGGACVPLDPSHPAERLAALVRDAAPIAVLSDAAGRAALGAAAERCVTLALDAEPAMGDPTSPRVPGLTSRHLAYVIYTSGSTGAPKGVMVEHAQLVRLFDADGGLDLDAHDVWCVFHSLAFDFSAWEIWGALAHGARLVIVPAEVARSPRAFHRLVCTHGVTVLNQTPRAFDAWLDGDPRGDASRLRYVMLGAEALGAETVRRCRQVLPGATVVNLYGPTESGICATAWRCPAEFAGAVVPIGRPVANTQIYLLDEYGEPVPIGAVGELTIAGDGVARGYLGRPERTAERFVRDPLAGDPAARMYRTGDLARYLPDGNLVFVGRNDHQVKVRGYRIEPGEIEARLVGHDSVREAVVVARGDGTAAQLVAYVTTRAAVDAAALRAHLAAQLPDYMVPAAYVHLAALPLTPNGKLDRAALPAPDDAAAALRTYDAPQGPVEQLLAAIWAEVLGVARVGRRDDFFRLGGHSLLAMQVFNRLEHELGVALEIASLFLHPELAGFATRVLIPALAAPELDAEATR